MLATRTTVVVKAPRAAGRRCSSVVCQAAQEAPATSRRSIAAALFAAPLIAVASPALALILDDEDLELLEKAKAARQQRLVQERATEREFVAASKKGAVQGKLGVEIAALQTAINNLSKSGELIEAGKVKDVPVLIRAETPWVRELKRTTSEIGGSAETKKFADQIFAGLSKLEKSAGQGNAKAAKSDYVSAVEALETWAVLSGLSGSVKGL